MPLFSEEIQKYPPSVQRHLYRGFQRAVSAGEIKALKLLSKFKIEKVRAGMREVFDYAYTSDTEMVVRSWILVNKEPAKHGTTAEQVQNMSDEQLSKLIAEQNKKPTKKRVKKVAKTAPKTKAKSTKKSAKAVGPTIPRTPPKETPEKTTGDTSTTGLSESTMKALREQVKPAENDTRKAAISKKEVE